MALFSTARKSAAAPSLENPPRHVAIIMDGNGRWATSRGLPRTMGHRRGAETIRQLLNSCRQHGVQYLTLYAFSAENWQRPAGEVSDLMDLLRHYLTREVTALHEHNIRIRVIGDRSQLESDIGAQIEQAERLTETNTAFNLTMALSYGGRQELAQAMRSIAEDLAAGHITKEVITEEFISGKLYTYGIPDPDLLIRTGGDQRLSNFLLWQSAYTELYFTPVLWPDFTIEHFRDAIHAYTIRERRYGTCS